MGESRAGTLRGGPCSTAIAAAAGGLCSLKPLSPARTSTGSTKLPVTADGLTEGDSHREARGARAPPSPPGSLRIAAGAQSHRDTACPSSVPNPELLPKATGLREACKQSYLVSRPWSLLRDMTGATQLLDFFFFKTACYSLSVFLICYEC